MNIKYLDAMPAVENIYNVALEDDEKVVFTPRPSMAGNENDRLIGSDAKITLTNQRVVLDNGLATWTVMLEEDVIGCVRIKKGRIFKTDYFSVTLNKEIIYNNGQDVLNGFHFYFKGEDAERFEEIMNHLFTSVVAY